MRVAPVERMVRKPYTARRSKRRHAGKTKDAMLHPPRFLRITASQMVITCALVSIAYIANGQDAALSLFYGAACAVIPQAYFALHMTMASRKSAQHAARLGLAAEGGKFFLSAAAFAVVFAVLKPAQPGLVFAGFGILWFVQLFHAARLLKGL